MSKYQENVGPYDGLTANNTVLSLIDCQVSFMHRYETSREKVSQVH
jgi:hypothetical protein